jgi:Domain of unknown function (DUF5666)
MNSAVLKLGLPLVSGLLLAACSGSGDDGSSSSSSSLGSASSSSRSSGSSTSSASSASSTSAAAVVSGTITGFGSVHVNGIHFETEHTTILKDDQPITQQQLRVGQVVKVRGHVDDAGGGVADSIEFNNNVEGVITSIDSVAGFFVVLGQKVIVNADTSFDDSLSVASLAGLKVGDRVEISGLLNAAGDIVASRIELGGAASSVELSGTVTTLDATAHTFKIGTQSVDFSAAQFKDFGVAGVANGNSVEVHGTLSSTNVLLATRIELKTGNDNSANARQEVEGLITRFASATDFDVAGKKITTTSNTRYSNGVLADLKLDARVEVEGNVNTAGVLVADKVVFRVASEVRLQAKVDSVDIANNQLTVLGVVIKTTSITRFEDKSSLKVERFSLANVVAGNYVEIRAGVVNGVLTATRLEREQAKTELQLRATVTAVNAPQFTAQGVVIATNANTRFELHDSNATTAAQFFAAVIGQRVTVIGTLNGTTFTATKVELHSNDD